MSASNCCLCHSISLKSKYALQELHQIKMLDVLNLLLVTGIDTINAIEAVAEYTQRRHWVSCRLTSLVGRQGEVRGRSTRTPKVSPRPSTCDLNNTTDVVDVAWWCTPPPPLSWRTSWEGEGFQIHLNHVQPSIASNRFVSVSMALLLRSSGLCRCTEAWT